MKGGVKRNFVVCFYGYENVEDVATPNPPPGLHRRLAVTTTFDPGAGLAKRSVPLAHIRSCEKRSSLFRGQNVLDRGGDAGRGYGQSIATREVGSR